MRLCGRTRASRIKSIRGGVVQNTGLLSLWSLGSVSVLNLTPAIIEIDFAT